MNHFTPFNSRAGCSRADSLGGESRGVGSCREELDSAFSDGCMLTMMEKVTGSNAWLGFFKQGV